MADYALFSRGQIWTLHCSLGWVRGYSTRTDALEAMTLALKGDPSAAAARLLLQDETGLVTSPPPHAFLQPG
ncbi:hypothetical protein ASE17_19745 [Phenylobacterium sp. Root77]|nr:hypothetical protein ASC73_17860 [Phenylobacterium sp. Root1277]KQW89690.1 hypothetical protein ASC79_18765 [Phenylobacterium sp. Root1290]KRC43442.1 hypothetical protein ASE17_19745 [Phenylobacterium sp. Root77]